MCNLYLENELVLTYIELFLRLRILKNSLEKII